MKLFPSLTLAALCAALAGCAATTQTISFNPTEGEQSGVTVTIDGTVIGQTPVTYEVVRTTDPTSHTVLFSKDGYISEQIVIESWLEDDGLCSFLDDYPVPNLLFADSAGVLEPEPDADAEDEEPAPVPAEEEAEEEEEDGAEPAVAPVPAEGEEEPAPAAEAEEPAPAAEEPAPEPAAESATETPAAPRAPVQPTSNLRTLKDIQGDLATLCEQRETGQISESEFNAACAKLEAEVRARYGK